MLNMLWILVSSILIFERGLAPTLGAKIDTCHTFHETNSPCRCNPGGFYRLVCINVTNLDTLLRFLREASEENLVEVSVRYSTIHSIPLESVGFLGYLFLNLKTVTVKSLFNGIPAGRVNLEQLHLDNVKVETPWTWKPLGALMDLKRLSFSRMPIEYVDDRLTNYISPTLESFSLSSTGTKRISRTAFSKFPELVYVSIQNTDIKQLERNMFPEHSKIKYFYFGRNKISHLPNDLFADMNQLRHVGFQDNTISEINFLTFSSVWKDLTALFLAGNPIKCECKLAWMAYKKSPFILTGRCQAPKGKYGKSLKSLNKHDFFC